MLFATSSINRSCMAKMADRGGEGRWIIQSSFWISTSSTGITSGERPEGVELGGVSSSTDRLWNRQLPSSMGESGISLPPSVCALGDCLLCLTSSSSSSPSDSTVSSGIIIMYIDLGEEGTAADVSLENSVDEGVIAAAESK